MNALETLESMINISKENRTTPTNVETREDLCICHNFEAKPDVKLWFHNIKNVLKQGIYLSLANSIDKRLLRKSACLFFLSGETFYKRSYHGILLRCVDVLEANRLKSEIREDSEART